MTIEEALKLTQTELDSLPASELAALNKLCNAHVAAVQRFRETVLRTYQAKQDDAAAAAVVQRLTPEKRASILRALALQEEQDAKARAAEADKLTQLANAVAVADAQATTDARKVEPAPADPLTLTDAQRSAILLAQEVKS